MVQLAEGEDIACENSKGNDREAAF